MTDCSFSNLRITNTIGKKHVIQNNTGSSAGAIGMYYGSTFDASNIYFYNNTS